SSPTARRPPSRPAESARCASRYGVISSSSLACGRGRLRAGAAGAARRGVRAAGGGRHGLCSGVAPSVFSLVLAVAVVVAGGCAGPGVGGSRAAAEGAAWRVIGESLEGRSLEARSWGGGAGRVYIIGGIHGNEPEGQRVVAE